MDGRTGLLESGEERRLADEIEQGESKPLERLYEAYSKQLYNIAYRFTGSTADARDVLHDVFCRLPEAVRNYDRKRPFAPWLRAVTAKAALERLRRERRRNEVSLSDESVDGALAGGTPTLDSIVLEQVLSSLSDGLRRVIVLKELAGYSHREIGKLLGISPAASRARLCRARAALRAMFEE